MPTPTTVDDVSFREISVEEIIGFQGTDTLVVTLRGATSLLSAARAQYKRYSSYTGYPNMFLTSKQSVDRGVKTDLILSYTGYIESDTPQNGLIRKSDDVTLQSVALTSDEGDNVTFSYYAQTTQYTWLARTNRQPEEPRFGIDVPPDIPVGYLFSPSPPDYDGSITSAYNTGARLSGFNRTELAPSVYSVTETWQFTVEPV